MLTFSALILGGGFFPQPGVSTRHRAAAAILAERRKWSVGSAPDSAAMPDGRPEFGPARPAVTPVAAATGTARHGESAAGLELNVGR